MTGRDDLEQRLPRYLKGRAPTAPAGLLDNLLRQTADLPQRRGILPFASSAWWAVGAAVALLVAALALRSALPGPSVPPGGQVSPSPSSEPSMTTITVTSPVHDKAIILQATDVMSARLRALGIGNFTASGSGDDTTFSFVLPASVDLADVKAVLTTPGDIEWLAWSAEPWPVEGDPVRPDIPPLFNASDEILSATVRPASGSSPEGVAISLGPLAADAVAAYTAAHIGEPAMPLAMDGVVLLSPTIQGVISSGGDLVITFGIDSPISAQALAAIMASGPLPAVWSSSPAGSPSPPTGGISQSDAEAAALQAVGRPQFTAYSAVAGRAGDVIPAGMPFPDLPSDDTLVWFITLWDGVPQDGGQGALVVVDYFDGTVYGYQFWIS